MASDFHDGKEGGKEEGKLKSSPSTRGSASDKIFRGNGEIEKRALRKSDLELPLAFPTGQDRETKPSLSLSAALKRNCTKDDHDDRGKDDDVDSRHEEDVGTFDERRRDNHREPKAEGDEQRDERNNNSNNNLDNDKGDRKEPQAIPASFASSSRSSFTSSDVFKLSVIKSTVEEPFGLVIQGGIDAPYIGEDGEEKTRMRIKEIKSGCAASRQLALRSGMEVLRVNEVDIQEKTHEEIVALIQAAGTLLDLDVIGTKCGGEVREKTESAPLMTSETETDDDDDDENLHFHDAACDVTAASKRDDADYAAHVATNAAIISACAAAAAKDAAANVAILNAARLEIDEKLQELERLGDSSSRESSMEIDEEEEEEERTRRREEERRKREKRVELATTDGAVTSVASDAAMSEAPTIQPIVAPGDSRPISPMSNILWGAITVHLFDSTAMRETTPTSSFPSSRCSEDSKTPSPYRIPTPSPMAGTPTDRSVSEEEQRRVDTPYPICFPRFPSPLDGRMTPSTAGAPPEVDVAQTLKEVVEATPYERPLTASSIHDPTEGVEEEEGRGRGRGSAANPTQPPPESETLHPTFDHSFNNSASTAGSFVTVERLDPLSDAANCKWRPIDGHSSTGSRGRATPLHHRTPPSAAALSQTAVLSLSAASTSVAGVEDHMYLFVGSLTLLAATAAMVGLFAAKRFNQDE